MGKSASRGTNKIPAEANQAGSVNDSPRQRDLRIQTKPSELKAKDLDDGPKVGERGEYQPSTYKTTNVRNGEEHEIIVEDF